MKAVYHYDNPVLGGMEGTNKVTLRLIIAHKHSGVNTSLFASEEKCPFLSFSPWERVKMLCYKTMNSTWNMNNCLTFRLKPFQIGLVLNI